MGDKGWDGGRFNGGVEMGDKGWGDGKISDGVEMGDKRWLEMGDKRWGWKNRGGDERLMVEWR